MYSSIQHVACRVEPQMVPNSRVSWHLESKKRINWLQSKCSAHPCRLLSARLVPGWLSKTVLQCGHLSGHSLKVMASRATTL